MNFPGKINKSILLICLIIINSSFFCQVKLPKLISDGMVLQRNAKVKVWGWAAPDEKISVRFNNKVYNTSANNDGEWFVVLSNLKAGGPFTMNIDASNHIVINDIAVGDIWICSGQSNMEIDMKRVSPIYQKEIAESENPYIRYFEVPDKYNFNSPQKDFQWGKWDKANPASILKFSAVAYFFAKEIYNKYKIPIGLINAALGGSPVEAWISEDVLKEFPQYYNEAQQFKDSSYVNGIISSDRKRINEWYSHSTQNDEGYKTPDGAWRNPGINTSGWDTIKVPGYLSGTKLGSVNGVIWFRRDFEVPASLAGKAARLELGRIVDADSVFINGTFVGTTGYQYPPRRYNIPESVLKEGKNTIVVRIISNSGDCGFVLDKRYELVSGENKIDLKGEWQFRLGAKMDPLQSETFIRWKPLGLFNAMIAPLLNVPIKGVIWYQGESNTDKAAEYQKLFPALIKNWRNKWNQGDFPFLYIQLPNFMETRNEPTESNWALLREAQFKSLSEPNTAMTVAIDLGEWNDIHPLNKKDVGKRLALSAEKLAYSNKKVIASGPTYESMKIEKNKIVLTFKNIGTGLISKGEKELKYFSIAGADKKFVWANAIIKKNKIVVWSDKVSSPVAVRNAWADNPDGANLYNKEGLPASPFRTDNF